VDTLEIQLVNLPDRGLSLDVVVAANSLKPKEIAPLPLDEIQIRGTLTPMVEQFLFQGVVSGTFTHQCDRCLENAIIPVSVDVTWTFEEGPEKDYLQQWVDEADVKGDDAEEAMGIFTFQGTMIDLTRPVWDEITLAAPTKFICSETCQGLCPVCGADRNTKPCNCEEHNEEETPTSNSGFAGLKDMFPDLPES
jgi:uncharacterized protein